MRRAELTYSDAIAALRQLEVPATITQTGGMNLALTWQTAKGYYLVTDYEDSLPWNREHHQGWTLGRYDADDVLLDWWTTSQADTDGLVKLLISAIAPTSPE
jgi:hypothetical protein